MITDAGGPSDENLNGKPARADGQSLAGVD
jgi:hypothetical protein